MRSISWSFSITVPSVWIVISLASRTVAAAALGYCALVGALFRMADTSVLVGLFIVNVALEAVVDLIAGGITCTTFLAASALARVSKERAQEARKILTLVTCESLSL